MKRKTRRRLRWNITKLGEQARIAAETTNKVEGKMPLTEFQQLCRLEDKTWVAYLKSIRRFNEYVQRQNRKRML